MDKAQYEKETQADIEYPDVLYRQGIAIVNDEKSAKNAVRYTKTAGYDFVKIYNSISKDVYESICSEAKEIGIRVLGHMPDYLNTEYVESEGEILQSSVEHISSVNLNDTVRIAKSGCYIDPTLAVEFVFFDGGLQSDEYKKRFEKVNPIQKQRWEKSKERHMAAYKDKPVEKKVVRRGFEYYKEVISVFRKNGGKILVGTDGCLEMLLGGYTTHLELQSLVRCSMSPYEALYAATVEPSKFLGTIDSEGTIEIKKRAKLVILDKNPLEDIANSLEVFAVIKDETYLTKEQIIKIKKDSMIKNEKELDFIYKLITL